jgi:molybdate transport system regulatory protein
MFLQCFDILYIARYHKFMEIKPGGDPEQQPRAGNKPSRFGRHPKAGYHVQASVWIEKDGQLYLGGGRVMLLERIDKLGSIAAAARSMNLTYSNAWHWIDSMNSLAPHPLVESTTGGSGGGHAGLTKEGHKAIARFHELRSNLEGLVDNHSVSFQTPI